MYSVYYDCTSTVCTPLARSSSCYCVNVYKYLLYGLVRFQCNVRHPSIQHEGEEIENQVGRSVMARKKGDEVTKP